MIEVYLVLEGGSMRCVVCDRGVPSAGGREEGGCDRGGPSAG